MATWKIAMKGWPMIRRRLPTKYFIRSTELLNRSIRSAAESTSFPSVACTCAIRSATMVYIAWAFSALLIVSAYFPYFASRSTMPTRAFKPRSRPVAIDWESISNASAVDTVPALMCDSDTDHEAICAS